MFDAKQNPSFVELVLVVDNTKFQALKTVENVHRYCQNIANILNAVYMPLNVFVALTGVVIWSEKDEFEIANSLPDALKLFADYNKVKLMLEHPHDNAQLLTGKQTTDYCEFN